MICLYWKKNLHLYSAAISSIWKKLKSGRPLKPHQLFLIPVKGCLRFGENQYLRTLTVFILRCYTSWIVIGAIRRIVRYLMSVLNSLTPVPQTEYMLSLRDLRICSLMIMMSLSGGTMKTVMRTCEMPGEISRQYCRSPLS